MANQTDPSRPYSRERRHHPRVPGTDLPFRLQGEYPAPVRVRDISRSGVAFYAEEAIPVMTRVRFLLEIPGDGSPRVTAGEGVVVRCERLAPALEHYEVAIFFHDMEPTAREYLADYVREHLDATGS